MELTVAPVKRLLKKHGAKRVSDGAAKELAKMLEEKAIAISQEAKKLAEHSGRRTVMRRDIKLARKIVEQQ